MGKILIIEDDLMLSIIIEELLNDLYFVKVANSAEEGLDKIKEYIPDLIILDIELGDSSLNGFDIARKIKEDKFVYGDPSILMLTSRSEKTDVRKGLQIGADDYLKKPFDHEELVLRVRNILKRTKKDIEKKISYKNLLINTEFGTVYESNNKLVLERREYDLLLYLVKNKGIKLMRDKIYNYVWNDIYDKNNRTVDIYIARLKKKIKTIENNIKTIRGYGYLLKV